MLKSGAIFPLEDCTDGTRFCGVIFLVYYKWGGITIRFYQESPHSASVKCPAGKSPFAWCYEKVLHPERGPGGSALHRHHRAHQGHFQLQSRQGRQAGHLCRPVHRKYYPNIAELSKDEVAKQAPFGAKWRLLAQVEVRCYILISNISGSVKVAPLQILQFPVILPHKFQDAEKFNLQFSDFSEITETADKLRWLRYQKGLRQRDVADYAGIYRSTYIHYEEYGKDFYSPKHMEKIAQLFEVPVERLLDDYNLFLRNGQGKQIKAIRMKLGLTQREYADRLGISLCNLKQWEQNRKQLFKSTWEKYFK